MKEYTSKRYLRRKDHSGRSGSRGKIISIMLVLVLALALLPVNALTPAMAEDLIPATTESSAPTVTANAGDPEVRADDASTDVKSAVPDAEPASSVTGAPLQQDGLNWVCHPDLELTKSGPSVAAPGDNILYDFTVTNTGDVDLTNITVDDPMLGGQVKDYPSIKKGKDKSFSVNYWVPPDAPAILTNNAIAKGYYGATEVTSSDGHSVAVKQLRLTMTKTGPAVASPGDTITYYLTVTNSSDAYPGHADWKISSIKVDDLTLGYSHTIGYLLPGQTWSSGPITYVVPADFTGDTLPNTATAVGHYKEIKELTANASWSVNVMNPDIRITKSGPASAYPGDSIQFHFKVENTGNVDLTAVWFNDPLLGIANRDLGSLAKGACKEWDETYTVPPGCTDPEIKNCADVRGVSPFGECSCECDCVVKVDELPEPGIELTKTGPESACAGERVKFHFKVENTGGADFSKVLFSDPLLDITKRNLGSLAQGACKEWDEWYTIPRNYHDDALTNGAFVKGKSSWGDATSESEWRVRINRVKLKLEKSGPESACVGDVIEFHFKLTNKGNVAVNNIKFTDDLLGIHDQDKGSLEPGECIEWDETYTVGKCAGDWLKNEAKVRGMGCCGPVCDDAECSVFIKKPGIKFEKYGPLWACAGDEIKFGFKVINTGNVKIHDIVFSDEMLGIEGRDLGDLRPGRCIEFKERYTVRAEDADWLMNTASVKGDTCCGGVSGEDCAWVFVKVSELSLTKSGPDCARVGDTITYDFTIKNTGNVPLLLVTVCDPMLGGTLYFNPLMCPGEEASFSKTYTIKDTDPATLVNTSKALGWSCCGLLCEEASHTVTVIHPAITLEKSADVDCARVGDTITYSFKVKNTGDSRLTGVTVTDPMLGGTIFGPTDMDALAEQTFEKTYVVQEGDPDLLENTATAAGTPCTGPDVTANASDQVTVVHPAITLEKSGPLTDVAIGDTITYSFKVTNTGDCKLTDVKVTDDKLGDIGTIAELDPLAEQTLTKDYAVVLADFPAILNTATVVGTPPCGPDVTAEAQFTVNITSGIPGAGITVTKTLDNAGAVTEGDLVTFTVLVTNSGQSQIPADIALNDTYDTDFLSFKAASIDPDDSADDGSLDWTDVSGGTGLASGESVSITLSFLALDSGSTSNGVTVEAKDPTGALLTDSDSAPVEIEEPVIPFTPQPPAAATPASVVQPLTALPRTGGDFAGLIALAWVMIPLGLVFMTAGLMRNRRRFRKA